MKFFLIGGHDSNAGPSNVNHSLIEHSDQDMIWQSGHNKITKLLDLLIKLYSSDRVLISGATSLRIFRIIQKSRKKYYYLMHGCIRFENEINHLGLSEDDLEAEAEVLKGAEKIICVSEGYVAWVKERYPQYADKITFVNNGISLNQRPAVEKIPFSVAIGGGNRFIKNNGETYKAIKELNKQGLPCKVYVFGRKYPDNDSFINSDDIVYCGHLNKEEYYAQLDKISLFVIDSEVEPFGLGIADALNCNCSLLMSKHVGSRFIMKTEETDLINDAHDTQEIAQKIKYLLEHPNCNRLFKSINIEDCSEASAYKKIRNIVTEEK